MQRSNWAHLGEVVPTEDPLQICAKISGHQSLPQLSGSDVAIFFNKLLNTASLIKLGGNE